MSKRSYQHAGVTCATSIFSFNFLAMCLSSSLLQPAYTHLPPFQQLFTPIGLLLIIHHCTMFHQGRQHCRFALALSLPARCLFLLFVHLSPTPTSLSPGSPPVCCCKTTFHAHTASLLSVAIASSSTYNTSFQCVFHDYLSVHQLHHHNENKRAFPCPIPMLIPYVADLLLNNSSDQQRCLG